MLLFFAGFVLSFSGSLPPGLISLSVAQTAIYRGMAAALAVAAGAAGAEFFQAWAAVVFSDWLLSHPSATRVFEWTALLVFLILGTHLFFFARMANVEARVSQTSWAGQFGKGVLLSAFNLMAVPYWLIYCGWLRIEGWWREGLFFTLVFAGGVTAGTLFALWLYAWLGQKIIQRSAAAGRYANRFIGIIFWLLALQIIWGFLS
jgi:threonine/homoserine/homoserine lactone efflux protein